MTGDGSYERDRTYLKTRITADGRDGYPVEPGRRHRFWGDAGPT